MSVTGKFTGCINVFHNWPTCILAGISTDEYCLPCLQRKCRLLPLWYYRQLRRSSLDRAEARQLAEGLAARIKR